ncbi:MAG: Rpn family recombination-promoting nuclease/putative transposase [Myxococcota bacterium]
MASPRRPPHDLFLKEILSKPEHAAGVLRVAMAPQLGAQIDWPTLRLINGSYVDAELKASFSDLVFDVKVRGAGDALVYCLWENQTTEDAMMPLRMHSYCNNALRQYRERPDVPRDRLPYVIPVLLYTGGRWTKARRLSELCTPPVVDGGAHVELRMEVLELGPRQLDRFEQARAVCDVVSRAALVAVSRSLSGRERGDRLGRLFIELRSERGPEALRPFWTYIGRAYRQELETIMSMMKPEVEAEAIDFLDELRMEGEARVLLRLLQLKFGELPSAAQARVHGAGLEQLDRWVERVLTAKTLEEVFGD